jgi:hypothetical protein
MLLGDPALDAKDLQALTERRQLGDAVGEQGIAERFC